MTTGRLSVEPRKTLNTPRPVRRPDLDIIVPAWNEEGRLEATLREVVLHTGGLRHDVSITVVDNGSVDRTAEVVDAVAKRAPDNTTVRVIGCSRQGKGAAVTRGLLASAARWRGFIDADLSTPPSLLAEVVARLEAGAQVVIGSRRCEGAAYLVPQPLTRRAGSRAFRMLTRSLVGGVSDTQCGFKFFTGPAVEAIFPRVTARGFAFDVEVLALATHLGMPVVEVPVQWTDDAAGSSLSVMRHGPRVLSEVQALRRVMAELR